MFPDRPEFEIFRGLAFLCGSEHLPGHVLLDLDSIRVWAREASLLDDAIQLVDEERISDISPFCSKGDELLIGIAIDGEPGPLKYVEYPLMPVKSIVRRGAPVKLAYWRANPSSVAFRFWMEGCDEEFCSMSTAKLVVPKFLELFGSVQDAHLVKQNLDGSRETTVEGAVTARFSKVGRLFDVEFHTENAA